MLHEVIDDQVFAMFKRKIATLTKEYKAKSDQWDQGKSGKWLVGFKILVNVYLKLNTDFELNLFE